MNTADAYEELLLLVRAQHPSMRTGFDDSFHNVVATLSTNRKLAGTRQAGRAITTKFTTELKQTKPNADVVVLARRLIATAILEASLYQYPALSVPLKHHWLPLCYSSNFTRGLPQAARRGASIPTLDYSSGEPIDRLVTDKSFVHGPAKDRGFYQLSAEKFFSIIEGWYDNSLKRLNQAKPSTTLFYKASFVAMLVIQTLRAPHPGTGKFKLRNLSDFATAAAKLLDSIETGYVYLVPSKKPLPFVAYAPTRHRVSVTDKQSWYFPLTSNLALIISEERLTNVKQQQMVEGSRASTIKWAQLHHKQLFGFTSVDLNH
jgi:hypothetical protein